MAGREELHAVGDSLPDGTLESAQAYLKTIQAWPPKRSERTPEVEKFRKDLEEKRQKFLGSSGTGAWAIDRNNNVLTTLFGG